MRANNWIIKATLTSVALFIASIASAQTATVKVVMAPAVTATQAEADNFVPGVTPFVLQIKTTETKNTNYHYSVAATTEDGTTKVTNGQVDHSDSKAGYTVTSVPLGVAPATVLVTISAL